MAADRGSLARPRTSLKPLHRAVGEAHAAEPAIASGALVPQLGGGSSEPPESEGKQEYSAENQSPTAETTQRSPDQVDYPRSSDRDRQRSPEVRKNCPFVGEARPFDG
jgi:hypothetical protein